MEVAYTRKVASSCPSVFLSANCLAANASLIGAASMTCNTRVITGAKGMN